jgi:hypothetical protein
MNRTRKQLRIACGLCAGNRERYANAIRFMSNKRSELSQESLDALALMGLALCVVHEIEDYLAQAVVLGITDRERTRSMTVKEYLAQRERMTFGQLVAKLKDAWELDSELEQFLDLFVKRRNLLVHGLTVQKGFDPEQAPIVFGSG